MTSHSLDVPDGPDWPNESGYAPSLRLPMSTAYRFLQRARREPNAYFYAYASLLPYRKRQMSIRQRMHVEYVLAQAYASDDNVPEALTSLEVAVAMADLLQEPEAQGQLAYLAGAVLHGHLDLPTAHEMYRAALDAHYVYGGKQTPKTIRFEIDLLTRLAGLDCELARFDHAAARIVQARRLLSQGYSTDPEQEGTLYWLEALIAHWTGSPDHALPLAETAETFLRRDQHRPAAGRICTLIGEIALDLTQSLHMEPATSFHQSLAQRAHSYATQALTIAEQVGDPSGVGIADLLRIRCQGMLGRNEYSISHIDDIRQTAIQMGDPALAGRAMMAIGERHWKQGAFDVARAHYGEAQRLFARYSFRALQVWPERGLLWPDAS